MKQDLKLVAIDKSYCDFLRKFDNKVAYNSGNKEGRPFIGALFKINKIMYFAPLASPKPKHLNPKMETIIDFIRIDDGKLGGININNMIPVTTKNISYLNLKIKISDTQNDKQYKLLLLSQLRWLIAHDEKITNKAKRLYDFYINDKLWPNLKARCCNWPLLEEKCQEYNK